MIRTTAENEIFANFRKLENYVIKHGESDKAFYEKNILGKKIVKMHNIVFDDYVTCNLELNDGSVLETHYRRIIPKKFDTTRDWFEAMEVALKEDYSKVLDKEIIKVDISYCRPDYVYCYVYTSNDIMEGFVTIPVMPIERISKNGDILD